MTAAATPHTLRHGLTTTAGHLRRILNITPATLLLLFILLLTTRSALAQQQTQPLVPPSVSLSEPAQRAIDAHWLTDEERAHLRVFHGIWRDNDLITPQLRAAVAVNAWLLDDPVLNDPAVPIELRAQALLRKGHMQELLTLLADSTSVHAARLRAQAHESLGQYDAAALTLAAPIQHLAIEPTDDPAQLTEAVRAMLVRSRLQGQPARDFHTMMNLLAQVHQQLDRLYWPALLTEAQLLYDKHDLRQASSALHEVLQLNPRCADAWYLLGRIAIQTFDFQGSSRAADHLRQLNPQHPLADLLTIEALLILDDPESALTVINPLLDRLPQLRQGHAFRAAALALLYDQQAMTDALANYDQLSPNSAHAWHIVGRHLSLNRQYEAAAELLEEAIRRQPALPHPQIELGLLYLQSGHDARARDILKRVTQLDPFNKRAANSLFLLEELAEYQQLETDHFIVRYKPGIDQVMVRMMPQQLEHIHRAVTERFQFEPDRKTIIELMPDHQRFAVRITGMPFIHTIAACTGPVIAMEVPREGRRGQHTGLYDWPRVLQHEYAHTVTLAQTRNRIPHWLTEAAAVEMERAPIDYNTARLLARSLLEDTLFDLDQINLGFVRPRTPLDRPKAYAQGHWMLQYMNERFGESAVIRLFDQYFAGQREQQAIPNALGISREEFFHDFLLWAHRQVRLWGLAEKPTINQLLHQHQENDPHLIDVHRQARVRHLQSIADSIAQQIGQPGDAKPIHADDWPPLHLPPADITDEMLEAWLDRYPDHADLLELQLRRKLSQGLPEDQLIPLLERYAQARPVDPFPHQQLARLYLASDTPVRAIPHLEWLDAREDKSPTFAVHLAHLYRAAGDLDAALAKATRALHIDPYHAANHELAAAIALQTRQYDIAHMHIQALTILEPHHPQHQRRLQAVQNLLNN